MGKDGFPKKIFLILQVAFLAAAGFIFFDFAFAGSSDLVISEIMYNPSGSDSAGDEWLEIANMSGRPLEFESFGIYKGQYRLKIRICDRISGDDCGDSHPVYSEKENFFVGKDDFFIITSDPESFAKSYSDYDGKILKSNFSLSNGSDNFIGIMEESEETKEWLGKLFYGNAWGGDENGKTLEKIKLEEKNEKENWAESYTIGGTPGEARKEVKLDFSDEIIINEILPDPDGKDEDGEWIEIFNGGLEDLSLLGWSIEDYSGKKYFFGDEIIGTGEYLLLEYEKSRISLNNSGDELLLFDPDREIVNHVSFGETLQSDQSWARDEKGNYSWTSILTPGEKNEFPVPIQYPSGIFFNEILPNPDGADKGNEWIEFYNKSDEEIDLKNWTIENGSGKKYVIGNVPLGGGGLALVEIENSSFSIRNSNEELKLLDPNGDLVDKVKFKGSTKSQVSFCRDGHGNWEWSRFLSPGSENIFNNLPVIGVKIPKEAYKDIRAYFDARRTIDTENDKLKFKWDFGDGHRSYLAKTSHVYEKNGKYQIFLEVDDGSEIIRKDFSLEVKSYPKKKLKIVEILPNPKGADSGNELVMIKNYTSQKVNLEGYKIATGKNKRSLVNHPINEVFWIDPGKKKEIDNKKTSKFSLLNEKGYVALKYPNDEIADMVKYEKEKIFENETYVKEDGQWSWALSDENETQKETEKENLPQLEEDVDNNDGEVDNDVVVLGSQFSWEEITLDDQSGRCDCFSKIAIENWKQQKNPILKWIFVPWPGTV
jgi:hypothetical protein